jgi:hypothetical protein
MSMLAAPIIEGAAADAAGTAAAGTAAKGAAGAASKSAPAAASKPAARKAPAKAPKATTAADRGRQLLDQGTSRADAARILRDEYGSTLAEAQGALPADTGTPAPAPSTTPAPQPATSSPTFPSLPKSVGSAASAGGGALLGAIGYVLFLTYMRNGLPGVKAWTRAKFLNQTGAASTGTVSTATDGPMTRIGTTDTYGIGPFTRQAGSR